jgi:hypothetical protein
MAEFIEPEARRYNQTIISRLEGDGHVLAPEAHAVEHGELQTNRDPNPLELGPRIRIA